MWCYLLLTHFADFLTFWADAWHQFRTFGIRVSGPPWRHGRGKRRGEGTPARAAWEFLHGSKIHPNSPGAKLGFLGVERGK